MAKLSISILVFLSIAIALPPTMAKVTKLHLFMQVTYSGPNQTIFQVAQTHIASTSPTLFGQVMVADDPFTVGPQLDSEILGRAQGMVCFADLNEVGPLVIASFVFTSGEYKGSTLSMMGKNNASQKYRQVPIVGGTGAFELAQGIISTSNYSLIL